MIYITGDIHGNFDRFSKKRLRKKGIEFTENDYVITHCCPRGVQAVLDKQPSRIYKDDLLTDYLQELEDKLEYKQWFFGHDHNDKIIDEKHTLLYYAIVGLGKKLLMLFLFLENLNIRITIQ